MYNVEGYVIKALDSLMRQTVENVECIIIDDGSTDRSVKRVVAYSQKRQGIILLSGANAGVSCARNKGLEVARGEFIFFMDADDVLSSGGLEALYLAAKEHGADVVSGVAKRFNRNGKWSIGRHVDNGVYRLGEKVLHSNLELLYSLEPWGKLIRREVVAEAKFTEGIDIIGTHPFILTALSKAKKMYTIDKVVYFNRKKGELSRFQHNDVELMEDILISIETIDKIFSCQKLKPDLKIAYYERLLKVDIRPALRRVTTSRWEKVQVAYFQLLSAWLQKMDQELLEKLSDVCQMVSDVKDNISYLTYEAKKAYFECVKVINQMNLEVPEKSNLEGKGIKVSVIVPVYNVEEYLMEALNSLVKQTLADIEIILVDDGSIDHSPDIMRMYERLYRNIILITQENAGPSVARNKGLEVVSGEFVFFMDSDDKLELEGLEALYEAAKERGTDITTGTLMRFNSKGQWFRKNHVVVNEPGEKSLLRNPRLLWMLGPVNKLFKRQLVEDIRFPEGLHMSEDQPFVIEAFLKAPVIYTVDKVVYYYRIRERRDASLYDRALADPVRMMSSVQKSLAISEPVWEKSLLNSVARHHLKVEYYRRVLQAEVWPVLRSAIMEHEEKVQIACFEIFAAWLEEMDEKILNALPLIHQILGYEVIDCFPYLGRKAKKSYFKCLKIGFVKMDINSVNELLASDKAKATKSALKSCKYNHLFPINRYVASVNYAKWRRQFPDRNRKRMYKLVLLCCSLLPIQKKVMFATVRDEELTDSFQFIYDELRERRPRYKVVAHLKRERKFKEFCRLYYDVATSKYVILDDYYVLLLEMRLRKKTDVIQTWHAPGAIKKFGNGSGGCHEEFEAVVHRPYTKVVATSKKWVAPFAEAFDISEDKVYPIGLPRTDIFFCKETREYVREWFLGSYPQLQGKKVITYAPTFRGRKGARANFSLRLDLELMKEALGDEYVVVLKLHPLMKEISISESVEDFVLDLSGEDISHVLMMTDVLIADYSAIVFEFALLERPMIFYAYDHESYAREQGFYYDYYEMVPGPIVRTTEQVVKAVQKGEFDLERMRAFKREFFDQLDGGASRRFVDMFIEG